MARTLRIGIDTGGTFTDVVVRLPEGSLRVYKIPSTPDDPARAVLEGVERALADAGQKSRPTADLIHGTTVGLNAILTGDLARTALVTNEGFEDLCEIGRQQRTDLYDLEPRAPRFPVPRPLRFGVNCRRSADGTAINKITQRELAALRRTLKQHKVEALAIGLLHATVDGGADEERIATALAALGIPVTCSAGVAPASDEFERFSTATLNAAIRPKVAAYLGRLEAGIAPGSVRLMRSSGGIMSAAEAREYPARAVFSGPAGGVAACARIVADLDLPRAACLDMGGTSTDVALTGPDGAAEPSSGSIAGLPLATPTVDIHTIGCGGGSIAYADSGGALRVGPESAGAQPGPACYGVGEEPTVTDAHVVLGHLGASTLLDGAFAIEPQRSLQAMTRLGKKLGLNPRDCARGVLEVAETTMLRALLVITVERRIDPASIPLIAFGGAGGLHAAALMQKLGMPFAIVPQHPGALSAVGLAMAQDSAEFVTPAGDEVSKSRSAQQRAIRAIRARTRKALADGGRGPAVRIEVWARLRFEGQGAGLWIRIEDDRDAGADLVTLHTARFGFVPEARAIEWVEIRARGTRAAAPSRSAAQARQTRRPPARAGMDGAIASRRGPGARGPETQIVRRDALTSTLRGPACIEEATGVTVVPAGCIATPTEIGLRVEVAS